jgi:putative membrane protein
VLLWALGGLFALEFALLAWAPVSRSAWLLENLLVVALLVALAASYRRFRFSRLSYSMIFGFLVLHEVGAHYTYSLVPYDEVAQRWFGTSVSEAFGFERNHFDRAIHVAYGALFFQPVRELLAAVRIRGSLNILLTLSVMLSTSLIYELIEWSAAALFGGDLGMAYLGTQGDIWDAHKDMALAGLGAVAAALATASFASVRGSEPEVRT